MPTVRIRDTAGQQAPETVETTTEEVELVAPAAGPEPAPESTASPAEAGFSAKQTEAIERLRRLGSRRVKLRAELEAVDRELLGDAILAAVKVGVPKHMIVREAKVARQTVYNVIERA